MSPKLHDWNSTARERGENYPCDGHLAAPDLVAFRAVDIEAPAPVAFRWLCQLQAAESAPSSDPSRP